MLKRRFKLELNGTLRDVYHAKLEHASVFVHFWTAAILKNEKRTFIDQQVCFFL